MDYVNYKRFFRNALSKTYLPTYGAFGIGGILALIYITNWEAVGRRVPVWKYHFEPILVENSNSTNAAS